VLAGCSLKHRNCFFVDKTHLIYQEYPGVLELLIDHYQDKIDAVVIFNFGLKNKGLLDNILSSFLQKTSANAADNQLFAYFPVEQQTLVKWGNQFEQLNTQMRVALVKLNHPWWGTSASMARNLCLLADYFLFLYFSVVQNIKKIANLKMCFIPLHTRL
jgi:hypothetical protein